MKTIGGEIERVARERQVIHMSRHPFAIEDPSLGLDFVVGDSKLENGPYSWWVNRPGDWCLSMTLAGEGEILFANDEVTSSRGNVILVSPNHPRIFRVPVSWHVIWIHFLMTEELEKILAWPEIAPGVYRLHQQGASFRQTLRSGLEILRLCGEQPAGWRPLAFNLLENILLRGCAGPLAQHSVGKHLFRAMEKLQDISRPAEIDDLAADCGWSRGVFYRKFKETVGLSPRQYRENHAMHYAQQLLENTALTVSEIAREVGMQNLYYFSTRFKKFTGISPTVYREQFDSASSRR